MKNLKKYNGVLLLLLIASALFLMPDVASASVESSLKAIEQKFIGTLMPVLAVIGIVWAGFSFLMGNQNARSHLILAIIGAVVGFGAPSLVSFIRGLIH